MNKDAFHKLKLRAYYRLYPHAIEQMDLRDFVVFAKTMLCEKTDTLFHSPVWDRYTDEDILVEYFSYLFLRDETAKNQFLSSSGLVADEVESLYDWFDEQVEKNRIEVEEKLESMEDEVDYTPGES